MDRLVIFLVLVVCCNAGRLGYNYDTNGETFPPHTNQDVVTKSFYFFAPPDDDYVPKATPRQLTSNIKKNVQVVVIKAPEYNAYTNAALDFARQAIESKTLVYVLSREPDVADLERRFQEVQSTNVLKPEVRFVKYRTPEDFKRAQETIKSQYDNLGGSSNSLDAAGAPVVESTSSVDDDDDLFTVSRPPFLPTGVDVVPGSSYLPPKRD